MAESPYGCTDSKFEVAYMKDGRFYAFARKDPDACLLVPCRPLANLMLWKSCGARAACCSRICGL